MGEAKRRRAAAGKMPTRQQVVDEIRQQFASANEAASYMVGMFEQVLRRGQVVPIPVLMNGLAQLTAAFGDIAGASPPEANLQFVVTTPFGTLKLERDIARRLRAVMGAAQDVPYQFPGKVDLGNQN